MLFFQTCLLIGYAWAHLGPRILGDRPHALTHVALLLCMVPFLPVGIRGEVSLITTSPAVSVLKTLFASVGVPICLLSATSPLLQRWHNAVHPNAGDRVYRLYSIGNVASLLILLAYPLVIEPLTTLRQQSIGWSIVLGVLAAGIAVTVILRMTSRGGAEEIIETTYSAPRGAWLWWVLLSAVPSSYLLGVTSYLTSDVAAVPFLWVVPLALYLAAFSIAFAGKALPGVVRRAVAPGLALICLVMIGAGWTTLSIPATVALHVITFFMLTTGCLVELYGRRPDRSRLTAFYLWIAVGGVIGGVFNSLIAPILFRTTVEYPVALLLCAALAIAWPRKQESDRISSAHRISLTIFLAALVAGTTYFAQDSRLRFDFGPSLVMALMGVPILLCFIVRKRPIGFALCTAALSGTLIAMGMGSRGALDVRRSFFGVHRVTLGAAHSNAFVELYHGTTLHGRQKFDLVKDQPVAGDQPLTYYHREGPLGQLIHEANPTRLSVIGLGVGSIAGYVGSGQSVRYYEIDPVVIGLANSSHYFSFLPDARRRGARIDIIEGDARLTLRHAPPFETDLLVLDAFSGDAIPVHLLTREAFELYSTQLSASGTLAVHISNHYLDLRQVVANNASGLGGYILIRDESKSPEVENTPGRAATIWVAVVRDESLAVKLRNLGWDELVPDGKTIWTDDYSNLVKVLK